jgi:hypothetical protein
MHFSPGCELAPIPTLSLGNAKFSLYLVDKIRNSMIGKSAIRPVIVTDADVRTIPVEVTAAPPIYPPGFIPQTAVLLANCTAGPLPFTKRLRMMFQENAERTTYSLYLDTKRLRCFSPTIWSALGWRRIRCAWVDDCGAKREAGPLRPFAKGASGFGMTVISGGCDFQLWK